MIAMWVLWMHLNGSLTPMQYCRQAASLYKDHRNLMTFSKRSVQNWHACRGKIVPTKDGKDDMSIDRGEMNRRLIRLSEMNYADFWNTDFDLLPEPKRVFRAIWELEAEVNNGGFYQYFWNSSAHSVPAIEDALRTIGAPDTARIVNDAIAVVGNLPWHDDDARQEKLEVLSSSIDRKLDTIDEAFFRYPHDLTTLLYRYVSRHRDAVGASDDF